MRTWLILATVMLAGCTAEQLPEDDSMGSQPAPGIDDEPPQQSTGTDDISFTGKVEACDAGWCFTATATNEGGTSYYVRDQCGSPFTEAMTHNGDTVYPREPMFTCQAFSTTEWAPGASLDIALEWDERLWQDDEMVDAEAGEYAWSLTFRAYENSSGASPVDLTITDNVTVE